MTRNTLRTVDHVKFMIVDLESSSPFEPRWGGFEMVLLSGSRLD